MTISVHLGDCLLIASDKRAMCYNVEKKELNYKNDDEEKLKLWQFGALAGTGDKIFLDRVMSKLIHIKTNNINQNDIIYTELNARLREGVKEEHLTNNTLVLSIFNGTKANLYSIPIASFFDSKPELNQAKPLEVNLTCFTIPEDLSHIQNFQKNLCSLNTYENRTQFLDYYSKQFATLFQQQSKLDPTVSQSFDMYFQLCKTGEGELHRITI